LLLIEIRIIPIGVGTSLSTYIARVIEVIKERELKYIITPFGTCIEMKDFDELTTILREIVNVLRNMDVKRIAIDIAIDIRFDKPITLESKVISVKSKLR